MSNAKYDARVVVKYILAFIALIVGMKYTDGAAFVVMVPCALAFLSGRNAEKLLFVVLVSIFTLVGNGFFMPKGLVYVITQRGLMVSLGAIMGLLIFGRRNSPLLKPVLWIVPYLVFIALVSLFGWSPLISYLKLALFSFVFLGVYAATNRAIVSNLDVRKFRSMFLAVASVILIGSVLVIPLGGVGYMGAEEMLKNPGVKSLFKGMANHSQALGPLVAFLGILLFSDWIFSIQKMDKFYAVLMLCVPVLLIKTASRTAMGAFLMGLVFVTFYFMRSRGVRIQWRSRVSGLVMTGFFVAVLAVLLIPAARERVARFVVKYNTEGRKVSVSSEDVLNTRQHKIDECLLNWKASPTIGNGFQVSENMRNFRATSLKQVLTAPVEKSTWVFAVLEEGGVVGEFLFVVFILACTTTLIRRKAYIGASCFVTMVAINLGEFTIFSMSGVGGSFWALTFTALVMDSQRLKAEEEDRMRASAANSMFASPVDEHDGMWASVGHVGCMGCVNRI